MKKIYFGVVGQIAAGKEMFAEYLIKNYGFTTFSLSTVIHKELDKRGINEFTRKTLQDVGDELRREFGDDVLAKRTIEILKEEPRSVVITGIRNPAEIAFFKKIKGFLLVSINAKRKIRFKRVLIRNKPWDPKNWKEFYKIDRRDYGIGQNQSGQQVGKCLNMADYVLSNNKDLGSLYKQIEKILKKIKFKNHKPA